jgi:CO/xanthine dehydrogenase Mo-binding subunit
MMTGFLHEKEFSRKAFVKGGGALIVGFSLAGAGLTGKASAADGDPFASNGSPDLAQVDSWLTIHPDNTASVRTGLHEVGGGSSTAMLMIAAEELDMDMSQMRFVRLDTNVSPDQGETSGSNGTRNQGAQVRTAVVAARSALLDLAAASLGVAKGSLTVNKGVVSGGGKSITYGNLLGDKLFNVQVPVGAPTTSFNPTQPGATSINAGGTGAKPISQYKIVGTLVPRIDIPDIVTGKYTYIQNIRIPGMLHGRVIRPRGQGAFGLGTDTPILSVDESSIKHLPNVQIVRVRNFLGVVAPLEYEAIQAAAQLKVTWADPPALPSSGNLWKQMRDQDSQGLVKTSVDSSIETIHGLPITAGNVDSALASAAKVLVHTYTFAQQDTVPIGPMCSVAEVTPNGAVIYSNAAYNYQTRQWVKNVLDALLGSKTLPLNRIRVIRYAGSSEYGGRFTSFDAAESAAIMSAVVGKPVRLQLMRWDQHGWNNGWVAHMFDLRGGMDSKGNLVAIEHADWLTPTSHEMAAEQQITGKTTIDGQGYSPGTISSGLQYGIPNRRAIRKDLPLLNYYFPHHVSRSPYRVQAAFAVEQLFDELAHAAEMDPYEFRLQNIATTATDPQQRWRDVLTSVAKLANWQPRAAASTLSGANVVTGRGIGFGFDHGTPSAAVAEIEVNKKTGKITAKHIYCCVQPGYAINPGGLQNNAEGEVVQVTSRVLLEQTAFNTRRVTSLDWTTYPIMRIKDAPQVTVQVLSRTDIPSATGSGSQSGGGGEAAAPTAPAIANAFFDATGVRMRDAPMTPARVRATLKAAGVA